MRKIFIIASCVSVVGVGACGYFWNWAYFAYVLVLPIVGMGIHDMLQTKRAILRNFPVLGALRYFFEFIRPEIQQYFVESDTNGTPISRDYRSLVYQRAKKMLDTVAFGTQSNVYADGYQWMNHSMVPKHVDPESLRVQIGGPYCRKPYSASIFNISAMSYGSLSPNAILALNGGAKIGKFYHNTGEGGISPYHLEPQGDLVWQIGTGYFSCRTEDGKFSPAEFQKRATHETIKMIEIKISQGAKPSHGGILPAAKVSAEIAAIRGVPVGKTVFSPPAHSAFTTPKELLEFIRTLRELSGGKPIGFKLCVGMPHEFMAIAKAMLETKVYPDFITVDGGEGGTGAAPLEFSNSVGMPLEEGLSYVNDVLTGFGLRKHIKIIAAGKTFTAFHLMTKFALGADVGTAARAMMLSLGCIQARVCNTNHCPTGVATNRPDLTVGLVVSDKKVRVANFQIETVRALAELLGAAGLESATEVRRHHILRRVNQDTVKTYEELFPYVAEGAFLRGEIPAAYQRHFEESDSRTFQRQVPRPALYKVA